METVGPQAWHRHEALAPFGGYVAWEDAHRPDPDHAHLWYVPVFLRLRQVPGGPTDLAQALRDVLMSQVLLLALDERRMLATELDRLGPGWPHEVRVVAHVATGDLASLPIWCEVLHVGAPVRMPLICLSQPAVRPDAPLPLPDTRRSTRTGKGALPVIAVIDDGIAFLNARFRAAPRRTRIVAVWLQAPEVLDPAGVLCGQVLDRAAIDRLLETGEDEADIYRRNNRGLLPGPERHSTNHAVSHGTHVLDLAAGAAPEGAAEDGMRALPILAVQLPPAAVRDTSGRRLEGYVVQALRWLIAQTLRRASGGPVAPLIINLSLGSLAGPGDDHAFLANWFQHETERFARLVPGGVLRIVAAYGNARRARLVARTELRAAGHLALDWCIQPDDHSASFAELRADTQRAGALRLRLQPPGAGLAALDIPWPAPGECWSLGDAAQAMVTGVAESGQRMVHLAVAPTAGPGVLAPPGRWQIGIASRDAAPALISVQVQRDDTPAGYRILGRQSWLDHPAGWAWDDETGDWTAPDLDAGCPVTREGTSVAYAGTSAAGVWFVGAVRPVTGEPGAWRPARYTAGGVVTLRPPGQSSGPSLAAPGDDGAFLSGRSASGVLSGTMARLSGTSVAAPAVTRRLALLHAGPDLTLGPDSEMDALLGGARPALRSPLLGYGVLREGA